MVKGVVEEWGLGGRPGVSCSRPATASTCARLSKGRVSRVSRVRARLSFGGVSRCRSLAGRATLPRHTCPACPVCSLTLLSPHSSLHLCPLSAFSPTLPVPRPAHHPAVHTHHTHTSDETHRTPETGDRARHTHVCSASPKLSWQLLFEKIGNMTVHVASPLPATHSRARSGTGTEVHPLSGGRARLRLARSPLQEGAQPSVQARWRGWLCDRGLI